MKNCKTILTLTVILLLSIIAYQQNQIIQLRQNADMEKLVESYLTAHYSVSSIDELIQKKLKEYGLRYTGNPFTTAIYPGQFQAENITGMHWYTYLAGQLQNRTDVLAYPSLSASYIIEGRDDDGDGVLDVVWAKNCTSGQIEFGGYWDAGGVDGSNASAVIQAAINALMSKTEYDRGTILIKAGRYQITSPVGWVETSDTDAEIDIIGEGAATQLYQYPTRTTPLIRIRTSSGNIRRIRIANLHLFGGTIGIELENAAYNIFENLYFIGQSEWAIYDVGNSVINKFEKLMIVHEDGGGIYLRGNYNRIIDCNIGEDILGDNAIRIDGAYNTIAHSYIRPNSDHHGILLIGSHNLVEDVDVYDAGWGIAIINSYNRVYRCRVWNTNRSGIVVWNYGEGSHYDYNEIIGCIIHDTGLDDTWTYRNGITLYRAQHTKVAYNIIYNVPSYSIEEADVTENDYNDIFDNIVVQSMLVRKPHSRARYNIGFVTENSGTATGLADGSFIAHGLSGTPTTVTLTCLNSTYDGVPVIVSWNKVSTNSTHIAINIYWANGTAITDPVIAVSWNAKYQP